MTLLTTVFGLLFLITFVASKTGPIHNKMVVCYYSSWASLRPDKGKCTIKHIDSNLCTHLIYVFAGLDLRNNVIKTLDEWQGSVLPDSLGDYQQITSLKKTKPHLKVSLAIGGYLEGSEKYSILAADSGRRKAFAKNSSEFLRKYNFDGLDFNWFFPTIRDGDPSDRANYVLLMKDLHEEFKKHNLLLTTAIGGSKYLIDKCYNIKELSKYVDYFHIMSYGYHGVWQLKVGPNSPLQYEGDMNVKFTIEYLMKLGCPTSKLVMGIPTFGTTFFTTEEGNLGDKCDEEGFAGPYTKEEGLIGYNELCVLLSNKTSGWKRTWHEQTSQSIARLREGGVTKVVTYDSSRSIANKARFAIKRNLAGVTIWTVDTDDFRGECKHDLDTFSIFKRENGVKINIRRIFSNYPLLQTVNEAIILAINEIEMIESVCYPSFVK